MNKPKYIHNFIPPDITSVRHEDHLFHLFSNEGGSVSNNNSNSLAEDKTNIIRNKVIKLQQHNEITPLTLDILFQIRDLIFESHNDLGHHQLIYDETSNLFIPLNSINSNSSFLLLWNNLDLNINTIRNFCNQVIEILDTDLTFVQNGVQKELADLFLNYFNQTYTKSFSINQLENNESNETEMTSRVINMLNQYRTIDNWWGYEPQNERQKQAREVLKETIDKMIPILSDAIVKTLPEDAQEYNYNINLDTLDVIPVCTNKELPDQFPLQTILELSAIIRFEDDNGKNHEIFYSVLPNSPYPNDFAAENALAGNQCTSACVGTHGDNKALAVTFLTPFVNKSLNETITPDKNCPYAVIKVNSAPQKDEQSVQYLFKNNSNLIDEKTLTDPKGLPKNTKSRIQRGRTYQKNDQKKWINTTESVTEYAEFSIDQMLRKGQNISNLDQQKKIWEELNLKVLKEIPIPAEGTRTIPVIHETKNTQNNITEQTIIFKANETDSIGHFTGHPPIAIINNKACIGDDTLLKVTNTEDGKLLIENTNQAVNGKYIAIKDKILFIESSPENKKRNYLKEDNVNISINSDGTINIIDNKFISDNRECDINGRLNDQRLEPLLKIVQAFGEAGKNILESYNIDSKNYVIVTNEFSQRILAACSPYDITKINIKVDKIENNYITFKNIVTLFDPNTKEDRKVMLGSFTLRNTQNNKYDLWKQPIIVDSFSCQDQWQVARRYFEPSMQSIIEADIKQHIKSDGDTYTLLDFGAGSGNGAVKVVESFVNICQEQNLKNCTLNLVIQDIDDQNLTKTEARIRQEFSNLAYNQNIKLNIACFVGEVQDDGKFLQSMQNQNINIDTVQCRFSLMYAKNPQETIKEIGKITRKNALIVSSFEDRWAHHIELTECEAELGYHRNAAMVELNDILTTSRVIRDIINLPGFHFISNQEAITLLNDSGLTVYKAQDFLDENKITDIPSEIVNEYFIGVNGVGNISISKFNNRF